LAFVSALSFQALSLGIFLLLKYKKIKKNTHKKKKTIEKKNAEIGGNLPSSSHSTFHFWLLSFAHLFQALSLDTFFSNKRKRKRKKNHR
jgi:hypothetical protein